MIVQIREVSSHQTVYAHIRYVHISDILHMYICTYVQYMHISDGIILYTHISDIHVYYMHISDISDGIYIHVYIRQYMHISDSIFTSADSISICTDVHTQLVQRLAPFLRVHSRTTYEVEE